MKDIKNKKLYWVWSTMRQRCSNKNNAAYKNYGGRGIKVCERWEIFENFKNDMGYPEESMTLERVDNNLDYSPKNCIWTSREKQNKNRRMKKFYEYNGKSMRLLEWSEFLNINYHTLKTRAQKGWTGEKLFSINLFESAKSPGYGAKLTEMNVRFIRKCRESGVNGYLLAKHYSIRPCTIYAIEQRKTWKHI